jgi:hypothetical protein
MTAKSNGASADPSGPGELDLDEVMVLFEGAGDDDDTADLDLSPEAEHYLEQAVNGKGAAKKRALYSLIKLVADGRDAGDD